MKIKIKPMSANSLWRGRRFKTKDYETYEKELAYQLPKMEVPEGKLKLTVEFGLSNKRMDLDNTLKPMIDIFQKKFNFNDNRIYEINATKVDVKKKEEYISYEISKRM